MLTVTCFLLAVLIFCVHNYFDVHGILANCPVFVQNEVPLCYTGQTAILKTHAAQWRHDLISGNYI